MAQIAGGRTTVSGIGSTFQVRSHCGLELHGHVPAVNCPLCDQRFPTHGVACTQSRLLLPIHTQPRINHWRVLWTGHHPCPECATAPGRPHHMPCEREYCPACGDGQKLISCLDHFLWAALPSRSARRPPGRGTLSSTSTVSPSSSSAHAGR